MTTRTDQATAELAATILPAVEANLKGRDGGFKNFESPLGRKHFSLWTRDQRYIDQETSHRYILEIYCEEEERDISIPVYTPNDAYMLVAGELASDFMTAKEKLAHVCASLGAEHMT